MLFSISLLIINKEKIKDLPRSWRFFFENKEGSPSELATSERVVGKLIKSHSSAG
jgi:hypothetical protein